MELSLRSFDAFSLTFHLGILSFLPVGGELGGHDINSQPSFLTCVGVLSAEPVPDSFSAGAEIIEEKPSEVSWE